MKRAPVGIGRLVAQRAAVCARVRLRDREPEPGALARAGRAAGEAVEEAADEVRGDSVGPRSSTVTRSSPFVRGAETTTGGAPWRRALATRFETIRSKACGSTTA